ncbi:MAG: hypothetical protein DMF63_08660 [Acidobacteria bacterium]|nr:MAG: hypothetical protein DMF63_08660 [Acidobacteriota bacterium]
MKYTASTTLNFRTRIFSLFVPATMMILCSVAGTNAAWGDFDTSFGFQGVTVDPITGYVPLSTAIQPDGKILVTGYRTTSFGRKGFFLRRYLSDGQLDTSFGTNGAALGPETNSFTTDYRGVTIVVQPHGKIAVAGWSNGCYAVWQFSSTGIKDKTFGQNGLLSLTSYPATGYPELNIQSGKLLLSLGKQDVNTHLVALVRLTSIGALDGTFGNSGESLTGVSGAKGSGTVIEPDGKITIGGGKFDDPNAKGLERKLANGQNDPTFSAPPNFSFGIIFPGLVKMANAKYAIRTGNLAGNGSITFYLERASSGFRNHAAPKFSPIKATANF